jgi:pyruvate,water dikinase
VAYRAANKVDQAAVSLSAVVQLMVPAQAAGVLFTADPLSGRRGRTVIDAVAGLGEALVAGRANPDHYIVDPGSTAVAGPERGSLSTDEVHALADLGRRIESHYAVPQDIEFALDARRRIWVLQARPITTLFPIPEDAGDGQLRVYVNANVLQGVYQPFTPMGLDLFRRIGAGAAAVAGFKVDPEKGPPLIKGLAGRLFIDLTPVVVDETGRRLMVAVLGVMEPLTGELVRELVADARLAPARRGSHVRLALRLLGVLRRAEVPPRVIRALINPDRARRKAYAEVEAFLAGIEPAEGAMAAIERAEWLAIRIPGQLFARIAPLAALGIFSLSLARRFARRAGVEEDAMSITRGLPHNRTTEMNLDLWARSQRLRAAGVADLLADSPASALAGRYRAHDLPPPVLDEVGGFLREYGFRAVAEIDAGVPRWEEDPAQVFAALANLMRIRDEAMAPDVQFERARRSAEEAIRRALASVRPLERPRLRLLFRNVRALAGVRESPKFFAIKALTACRRLLLRAGAELAAAGRLDAAEDIFFLTLREAKQAAAGEDKRTLVAARKAERNRELKRRRLPRLLLSDGTCFYGDTARPGAEGGSSLAGSAASPGVYSGTARVVLEPAGAQLEPGEVLVAPFTDPGWTPLFMTAGALVMEMGGMMSHGSIVAREYGIPAVVGVAAATTAIKTGQKVTVDGTKGLVMLDGREGGQP